MSEYPTGAGSYRLLVLTRQHHLPDRDGHDLRKRRRNQVSRPCHDELCIDCNAVSNLGNLLAANDFNVGEVA